MSYFDKETQFKVNHGNQIINKIGTSVIHVDTTDGEITLAELKNANEATVVNADIVEIFYNLKWCINTIDRGVRLYKIIQCFGTHLIGHVNIDHLDLYSEERPPLILVLLLLVLLIV